MATPRLSIVLATWNRRDVLLTTLARIAACGLDRADYEIIVVDNASTDGTATAARGITGCEVISLDRNLGSCAKAVGLRRCRAPVALLLDDDSWPRPGSAAGMLDRFARSPRLGAAGFTVHLSGGGEECSALPHVFVGCGVGIRIAALESVGGLDSTFFMQAEEYDLSFRLLSDDWEVEVFDDLHVEHAKSPAARRPARTTYFDVRNNLRVIGRHLPDAAAGVYWKDWTQRYRWLAQAHGHGRAYFRGLRNGMKLAIDDRLCGRFARMTDEIFEAVFQWREIRDRMSRLVDLGIRRIALADLGKNAYPFVRAATAEGIQVVALGDDRFARLGRHYRGIPIVPLSVALESSAQAVVVSNTSPVHARIRARDVAKRTSRPVFEWTDPSALAESVDIA